MILFIPLYTRILHWFVVSAVEKKSDYRLAARVLHVCHRGNDNPLRSYRNCCACITCPVFAPHRSKNLYLWKLNSRTKIAYPSSGGSRVQKCVEWENDNNSALGNGSSSPVSHRFSMSTLALAIYEFNESI
jgi:hypothetical protein